MALGPFFVGERIPFTFTIKDKDTGLAVDLTTYDATPPKIMMRKDSATTNKFTTAADENGSFSDAANGKITYTMPSAWLDADVGNWSLQIRLVTDTGSLPRDTEKINFRVDKALVPSV